MIRVGMSTSLSPQRASQPPPIPHTVHNRDAEMQVGPLNTILSPVVWVLASVLLHGVTVNWD